MTWLEKQITLRVAQSGTPIKVTPEFTQSSSIDSMTGVATFSPSSESTLVPNDDVSVEFVDLAAGITRYQFVGQVLGLEANSQPADLGVPANDVLANLDFVRKEADGDYEMTGKSPDEVLKDVLEYVGISYTDADITTIAYTLGAQEPVYWRVDEPASTIVDELNIVFGMALFVVANSRVIWNHYDLAYEDATGLYRTITRGSSRDLWDASRSYGRPDQIQNAWKVTGPTIECGSQDACQCTVVATARAANPQAGTRGRRRQPQTFSSDLIQSTPLAEHFVKRMMHWYNRYINSIQLTMLNDTNVHPTTKIKYKDNTNYMDLAAGDYFTVVSVDRNGMEMTVTGIGGAPGAEGTVASTLEMVCNRTETDDSGGAPGSYTEPDFGYPPIDDGLPFDTGDPAELPTEEVDEVVPPDPIDPFLTCTEIDGMAGGGSWLGGDGYVALSAIDDGLWRDVGGASARYHLSGFGVPAVYTVDEIIFFGGGTANIALNETTPYASKLLSNDFSVGAAPALSISLEVRFEEADQVIEISFGAGGVRLFSTPGDALSPAGMDPMTVTALLDNENDNAYIAGDAPEHTCVHPSTEKNNGGVREGGGFPIGEWVEVSISFDYSGAVQSVYYSGPDGGYMTDVECPPIFGSFPPPICTDVSHRLEISASTEVPATAANPTSRIRALLVGHTTCTVNPDFDPDTLDTGS